MWIFFPLPWNSSMSFPRRVYSLMPLVHKLKCIHSDFENLPQLTVSPCLKDQSSKCLMILKVIIFSVCLYKIKARLQNSVNQCLMINTSNSKHRTWSTAWNYWAWAGFPLSKENTNFCSTMSCSLACDVVIWTSKRLGSLFTFIWSSATYKPSEHHCYFLILNFWN